MKITIFLLAACIFSLPILAQPATQNANKMMGDPIPGVGVNLTTPAGQLVQQAKTDAAGNVTFSNVAQGKYLLTIVSPRDAASGQASGKRAAAQEIKSPRDAASGQASGKRIVSPRDPASGQATGKRLAEVPTDESATGENNQNETRAGVSTSRAKVRSVAAEVLLTGDPDTPPAKTDITTNEVLVVSIFENAGSTQKTINTSRSNIKTQKIQHWGDPHEVTVGTDGQLTLNVLKTKHDTAKNSINNVR